MSYFLKSGATFRVSSREAMDLHEALPAGNYTVKFDQMSSSFYLEQIDSFEVGHRLYGRTPAQAQRILNTFQDRTVSTGVMLSGEKGSGKTLLARLLSVQAAEQGMPTIVINSAWCGDQFNAFLQMIDQPCVVLFDEFEKVYDREDQEKMLTLLDGVYPSKKLFVLTCNDKWRVDQHMRNRPGRIYYMLEFRGLDLAFVREYCEDNLVNKHHIDSVCTVSTVFDQFNFDMLKALVEEMNRYNESAQEAMEMLNAKPEFSNDINYSVTLQPKGQDIDHKLVETTQWHGNPLTQALSLDYKVYADPDSRDSDWDWETCRFVTADLRQIDSYKGRFVFVNADGDRVTLSRVQDTKFNYFNAF
jgi:hypothetical protein